jgi:isopenicillin N synthase-like dioxygenase
MKQTMEPSATKPSPDFEIPTSAERKVLTALPVIDVSPFVTGGSAAERQKVAGEIRRACIDIGFFYITGHGVASAELEKSLDFSRRFFSLPLERKMTVSAKLNPANMGFVQTGGLNPQANANADQKERLFLSRELEPGEAPEPGFPAGMSQWPAEDLVPGFNDFVRTQIKKRLVLARDLARAFSLSLGLPEDYLRDLHSHPGIITAFNFYPPTVGTAQWGFAPHTDYGSFTILVQDDLGGLQARNAGGEWIDVPPIPGTFVVNVGDLLARWTNDVYVSTLHRAINLHSIARHSISFFVYGNNRAEVRCLETCHSDDHPIRYEPVLAGKYVTDLLAQAHRTGRAGLSAETAKRLNLPTH